MIAAIKVSMDLNDKSQILCTAQKNGHYKIFCVNVKYGIHYWFRIFLFNSFAK